MVTARSTHRLRRIKADMRARRVQPCGRCGQRIDYTLPTIDPDTGTENPGAFSLGHIKPWSTHPELREDPSNLRPEHLGCNKRAGDRPDEPQLGDAPTGWWD